MVHRPLIITAKGWLTIAAWGEIVEVTFCGEEKNQRYFQYVLLLSNSFGQWMTTSDWEAKIPALSSAKGFVKNMYSIATDLLHPFLDQFRNNNNNKKWEKKERMERKNKKKKKKRKTRPQEAIFVECGHFEEVTMSQVRCCRTQNLVCCSDLQWPIFRISQPLWIRSKNSTSGKRREILMFPSLSPIRWVVEHSLSLYRKCLT